MKKGPKEVLEDVVEGVEEEEGKGEEDEGEWIEGEDTAERAEKGDINDKPYSPEESELYATPEEHLRATREGGKGGGSRKKIDPTATPKTGPGESSPRLPQIRITRPIYKTFSNESTSPPKRSRTFYNYWNALTHWEKERTMAYLYRDHPVLLTPEVDPITKEPKDWKYIDKIDGLNPIQSDQDLLNRYGAGSYHIIFQEVGQSGKKQESRELCTVFINWLGGSDYHRYPPHDRRIDDPQNIDLSFPGNKTFINYLRSKGIFPEEERKQQEEAEMANVQVQEVQGKTIEKLTDKVLELADRTGKPDYPPPSTVRPEDISRAVQEGISRGLEQFQRLNPPVPPQPQKDPMELALQLVQLMNQGRESGSVEVERLRAELAKMQQAQLEVLAGQVKTLMESKTTGAASGSPFAGVTDGLDALKRMKGTLEELGLKMGGEDVAEEAGDMAPKWLQKYMPLITMGMGIADKALSAWLAPRVQVQGMGQGMNPGPGQGMNQGPINPMPMPNPTPPTPSVQSLPPGMPPELARFLESISTPLATYLADPESTGSGFATLIEAGWGERSYKEICGFGMDGILGALAAYPTTANILRAHSEDRVKSFLGDFLNPKDEEGEEEGDGISAGPEVKTTSGT